LDAIAKNLPERVEFSKFVDSLQPHFIPLFGEDFPEPPSELDKIEHLARLERLKLEQENREYAEMTKAIDVNQRSEGMMEGFGKVL